MWDTSLLFIINLHPDFPFVESILEKRGKIWVLILSMEYILTCHIQSLSRFFAFFQEFCKNGVKSDNSSYKWNISQLVVCNLYPIFHYFQRILEKKIHLIKRIYPNMPNEFFNEFWKRAKLCPFILKLE